MNSYFKFGVVFCVVALSIAASAGSIATVGTAVSVTDGSTLVQGSGTALTFVGGTGTVAQSRAESSLVFDGLVSSSNLSNPLEPGSNSPIVPMPTAGQYRNHNQQVPEGGTQLSYLAGSGMVLFAGIFLAGKQRRRLAEN